MVYYSLNSRISYIYKDIHTTHSAIHCKTEKISIVSSRIPSSKTIFLYIQRFIWKHKNIYTCYNFFTIYTINGKEDIIIRFYHSYSIPRDKYSIDEQQEWSYIRSKSINLILTEDIDIKESWSFCIQKSIVWNISNFNSDSVIEWIMKNFIFLILVINPCFLISKILYPIRNQA